jgi:hypothetical protein
MALSYRNRKGITYFLHARRTKAGKVRYVFARSVGEGPVDEIPDGYEVHENVNGQVSLAKARPRSISAAEEEAVRSQLEELSRGVYRIEVKSDAVVVHEPLRSPDIPLGLSLLTPLASRERTEEWVRGGSYSPVLRFVLDDPGLAHVPRVERMTYRGDGGWSWPLGSGKIGKLAKRYLSHLGEESFFDLM